MQRMRIITPTGVAVEEIGDTRDRSTLGKHANAVGHFLATGDTGPLIRFKGIKVAGHLLATDPDELETRAAQGELEFEEIYRGSGR